MKTKRQASALVAVLVVLTVASLIAGELVQTIVLREQASRDWLNRRQAQLLAESALERALVMRNISPEYSGETWTPASEEAGRTPGRRHFTATIKIEDGLIQVQATCGAGPRRATCQLDYPVGDEP